MIIAVVGLGLIGGSFCKTIKKKTNHTVLGLDISKETVRQALEVGAIDREISVQELEEADLTFLCLYPQDTISFLKENADCFRSGSVVSDTCGIKDQIVQTAEQELGKRNVDFVGTHPMAGREFSGFSYSTDTLFDHASFIVTATEHSNPNAVNLVTDLAVLMGFREIVRTDAKRHDEIIAFTSQLAHVVSNAYMKSPTAQYERGFTGGSFQDLTRVAMLNDKMWTELFSLNREPLLYEINTILGHLDQYRDALEAENYPLLRQLLYEGSELKKKDLKNNSK